MRRRRLALAAASPLAACQAAALAPLDRLAPFAVVSGYRPIGGEMDPGPLLEGFARAGASIALPVAIGRDVPLQFRGVDAERDLVPDTLGIPSPRALAPRLIPDLVVAPVLAFDPTGARLGQGAGLFDRTVALLRARGTVFVLGLAYAGQEVDVLPFEAHDQRLDAILTEGGYREFPSVRR